MREIEYESVSPRGVTPSEFSGEEKVWSLHADDLTRRAHQRTLAKLRQVGRFPLRSWT